MAVWSTTSWNILIGEGAAFDPQERRLLATTLGWF